MKKTVRECRKERLYVYMEDCVKKKDEDEDVNSIGMCGCVGGVYYRYKNAQRYVKGI